MTDVRRLDSRVLAPYLEHLHMLPFIRGIALEPAATKDGEPAALTLQTSRRTFTFALEIKQSFLDRVLTNAVIASQAARHPRQPPLLLMARYIPRPTGERLAEAGLNFVDRLGNMHLTLGEDHHVLRLGRREPAREATARRPGPALVQLYFMFLAEPAATTWSVRRLADEAGISKTAAATAWQRLVRLGVLTGSRKAGARLADRERLIDAFLQGYVNVLRPHLAIGRFRAAERDQDTFLRQVAETARQAEITWALTGGPAAYALDRFYRDDDVPLFVNGFTATVQRALRLAPDREGPITLLRPFGRRWIWKMIEEVPVAHPWLVYAELLHHGDPRALEAAEHVRGQFLTA